MTRPGLLRYWWQARQLAQRIGLIGLAGVLLLMVSAGFLVAHVHADRAQLARLDQVSLTLRERAQRATSAFDEAELPPAEQLARFYGSFPDLTAVPDVLGRIHQAAHAQGLVLEQGEYRIVTERGGTLRRYRITLPVKGPYLQVRQFLATALHDAPFVALDSVRFQRDAIGQSMVEAQIHLTIYLGGAS